MNHEVYCYTRMHVTTQFMMHHMLVLLSSQGGPVILDRVISFMLRCSVCNGVIYPRIGVHELEACHTASAMPVLLGVADPWVPGFFQYIYCMRDQLHDGSLIRGRILSLIKTSRC